MNYAADIQLPSGLYVPERIAWDYFQAMRRPVAVDLFCGAGGMGCGLHQGGFDVIAAAEYDAASAITYLHNLGAYPCKIHCLTPQDEKRLEKEILKSWGTKGLARPILAGQGWISEQPKPHRGCEHFFFGDVRNLTGRQILDAIGLEIGEVDLVAGGPPCQGFSRAGKQQVMDPRNSLVFEFARLVCEIQPKTMVFENVPGIVDMVTPDGVPVIDALCLILEKGGMGTHNALRRSLSFNPNARAVVRGSSNKTKSKPRPVVPTKQVAEDLPLFD